MDETNTSDHLKGTTSKLRKRKTPTTLTLGMLTPPAPKSMVLPDADTPQPLETSDGGLYLKIIGDAMAKLSPTGMMSEIFALLAEKFKEKEGTSTSTPAEPTDDLIAPSETAEALILEKPNKDIATSHSGNSAALIPSSEREEVGIEEQGDHQEERHGDEGSDEVEVPEKEAVPVQAKGRVSQGGQEVTSLEEDELEEDDESLSQRATRRNLRRQRKLDEGVPTRSLVEDAKLTAAKLDEAERKRKGKRIATTSKGMKRRSTSQDVIIQEPTESLNKRFRVSDDEREANAIETSENGGVYEKLKVKIEHKLLEAMVYFKDPIKRKNCAGRGLKDKKAKSEKRVHTLKLQVSSGS